MIANFFPLFIRPSPTVASMGGESAGKVFVA